MRKTCHSIGARARCRGGLIASADKLITNDWPADYFYGPVCAISYNIFQFHYIKNSFQLFFHLTCSYGQQMYLLPPPSQLTSFNRSNTVSNTLYSSLVHLAIINFFELLCELGGRVVPTITAR